MVIRSNFNGTSAINSKLQLSIIGFSLYIVQVMLNTNEIKHTVITQFMYMFKAFHQDYKH